MTTTYSWRRKGWPPPDRKALRKTLDAAAVLCGFPPEDGGQISVVFSGADEMKRVNRAFTGRGTLTDVIAFDHRAAEVPGQDSAPELDIIVSPDAAAGYAAGHGRDYSEELTLYIVHGLLHAAGEDDLNPAAKRKMRARERSVMAALNRIVNTRKVFSKGEPG
jgi:probable rRNA maturation factor